MKIAVFTKNASNPAYTAARLGAERVAARFGATVQHYVPTIPDDAPQQSRLILEAVAAKPAAIVFTPVHPTRVNASIAAISAARIPIFGFVNRIDPSAAAHTITYVGSADDALARDIATYLCNHLHGRGHVVVVEGLTQSVTNQARLRAFDAVLGAYPGIRVVARCNGQYLREPARDAFAAVLREQPRIDAVLAANDIMAIGVLDALDAAQRTAIVAGVNAIPQAIEAIGAGRMLATAAFNAMQMCALATECAIRHTLGETVPREIELPAPIVDRHNWQEWNQSYEQRALPSIHELKELWK